MGVVILVYVLKNPNQIYHAKYLDKINNNPENIFVVKHTIFNRMSCADIENWAKNHIDYKNLNAEYITFVSYSSEIDENYPFLKKDYSRAIWSDLICDLNVKDNKCIVCRKWYE
ncbi:hypothetical protein [Moraxella sp.]|uniref:hypothetical protein n=1 Tax=Moraxella sp. TaxID=479 RepID=UPI0026DC8FE8|nr:hypothetical protein [Moraxella sp.]MDO4895302.1 hypothetical protein [Moraxella sp.]